MIIPKLKIIEVPSGTNTSDWRVPDEWNVENAFIVVGKGILIFKLDNNTSMSVGCVLGASTVFGKNGC